MEYICNSNWNHVTSDVMRCIDTQRVDQSLLMIVRRYAIYDRQAVNYWQGLQ